MVVSKDQVAVRPLSAVIYHIGKPTYIHILASLRSNDNCRRMTKHIPDLVYLYLYSL